MECFTAGLEAKVVRSIMDVFTDMLAAIESHLVKDGAKVGQ